MVSCRRTAAQASQERNRNTLEKLRKEHHRWVSSGSVLTSLGEKGAKGEGGHAAGLVSLDPK